MKFFSQEWAAETAADDKKLKEWAARFDAADDNFVEAVKQAAPAPVASEPVVEDDDDDTLSYFKQLADEK